MGLGEDWRCVIGKLVVGQKQLVEIGQRHTGKDTRSSIVNAVAKEAEHLQATPFSALNVYYALTVQAVEV